MYQKTVQKEAFSGKTYDRLKALFEDLEELRKSPSVKAYLKKLKAELKG